MDYPVTAARYTGATPLSSLVMNRMQDNIEDAIDQNVSNIGGEEYDATLTYLTGDIRKHNGQLVMANQDILEPEEFDPEKWDATDVLTSAGGNEIAIGTNADITGKTKLFVEESTQTLKYKSSTTGQFENLTSEDIVIGEPEDVTSETKIFINEEEGTDAYSEVVDSLSGDEIAKAPSVHTVNEALSWKKATGTTIPQCEDVIIYVKWGNNGQYCFPFFVNYSFLQTGEKNLFSGGYNSTNSNELFCRIRILNNVVTIISLKDETGDISNPSIDIYYK